MFIYEGNRAWVEQRLKALLVDERVARVCQEVGARLDGSDSLFTLCAVDDLLQERVGVEASPLQPPADHSEPVRPKSNYTKLRMKRLILRRSSKLGVKAKAFDFEAAMAAERERFSAELARYESSVRFRDSDRSRVEAAVAGGTVNIGALLTKITRAPEQREKRRELNTSLEELMVRVSRINEFGVRALTAFSRLGYHDYLVYPSVEPFEPWSGDGEPLGSLAEGQRQWLTSQLTPAKARPALMSFRSAEASQVVERGVRSLLEAAEAWLARWEVPECDDALLDDASELVRKAADRAVELLESAINWVAQQTEAPGAGRRRIFVRSLNVAFGISDSFDDDLPGRAILEQRLIRGAFEAKALRLPPKTATPRAKTKRSKKDSIPGRKKKARKKVR